MVNVVDIMSIESAPRIPASFTEDYLNSMTRNELMRKYGIGATRCNTWVKHIKGGTTIRPVHKRRHKGNLGLPTYISKNKDRYLIFKKINGKSYYFGTFKHLEDAEEEVKRLKSNGWER